MCRRPVIISWKQQGDSMIIEKPSFTWKSRAPPPSVLRRHRGAQASATMKWARAVSVTTATGDGISGCCGRSEQLAVQVAHARWSMQRPWCEEVVMAGRGHPDPWSGLDPELSHHIRTCPCSCDHMGYGNFLDYQVIRT